MGRAAVLVLALATLGVASLGGSAPDAAATGSGRGTVVMIRSTSGPLGRILVDGQGRTLYVDAHDRTGHTSCTGHCATLWPPLLLAPGATRATAGPGVKALGTIRRPDHRRQVTSHGLPLYRYVGDRRAGQTHGEGAHATFFVAAPNGVHRPVPATVTTPTVTPSTGVPAPTTTLPATPAGGTTPAAGAVRPGGTGAAPPATAPPATSPPPTRPPPTAPPATSPPPTSPPATVPVGGGAAY